jgi:NitT/TauT family transport system substrate-binding protein
MTVRIMASRHSAFYSPLLSAVRLLRDEGHEVPYAPLAPGQKTYELLRDGAADVVQSAVSSNWRLLERGIQPLPVHFAQINCRDGFFLVAREPDPHFTWSKLEGRSLSADHGEQPLAMLKYALQHNGVDWNRIDTSPAADPDYTHQQGPVAGGHIVASVGAALPPVAFSSVCCSRDWIGTPEYAAFLDAFRRAREWVRTAPPAEVAGAEVGFFPRIPRDELADTVRRYQELGCWSGEIAIPRDLYEQALEVFAAAGGITARYPYDSVVATPWQAAEKLA